MLHKQFDKFNGWKCSFYIFVIFMTVIIESNSIILFVTVFCKIRAISAIGIVFLIKVAILNLI